MEKITIAIDWFTWTGKWTTSKWVANKLWYTYLDTWAMYRATTLYAIRNNLLDATDQEKVAMLEWITMNFQINPQNWNQDMILNWENVEKEIRNTSLWLQMKPIVTCIPLRKKMIEIQAAFWKQWWIVWDWRDIWTHVFPEAELKIFLTCDVDVRVKRRVTQLTEQWLDVDEEAIRAEIIKRDSTDYISPDAVNKKADDAIEIDTTNTTIQEQINLVVQMAEGKIQSL